MYERAASLATFSSNNCNAGQTDVTVRDGACFHLPGQGVDVWWTEGDCRGMLCYALSFLFEVDEDEDGMGYWGEC
jgi:hypothetical protein